MGGWGRRRGAGEDWTISKWKSKAFGNIRSFSMVKYFLGDVGFFTHWTCCVYDDVSCAVCDQRVNAVKPTVQYLRCA